MTYKTDKTSSLIPFYDQLLGGLKNINLLEVGTSYGGSLQYFGDKLLDSKIYGIDLVEPTLELPPNVEFMVADQNSEDLDKVFDGVEFDVIIDDGSHRVNETRNTYNKLFPRLKSGGMYIIEDWGVGYWEDEEFKGMKELVLGIVSEMKDIKGYQLKNSHYSYCVLWKK